MEAELRGAAARRVLVVVGALLLLWWAIRVNVVLYDERGRPRLAASEPGLEGRDEAASLRKALDDNPAEAAVLLMLARDREDRDRAAAARAYRAALEIAPHDREVLALAAAFFLRQEDPAAIELLGRLAAAGDPGAFAALASLLSSDRHGEAIARLLSRRPAWLGAFVLDACRRGVDPRRFAPFLPQAAGPAMPAESSCAVERLRADGAWGAAYQVWLNSLPRERLKDVGFVFNGGFEHAPTGAGFDWVLQARPEREAGHAADVLPTLGAGGKRALRVTYNGKRQSEPAARQFLALAPGQYELAGVAKHEGIKAVRGIQWTLRCIEGNRPGRALAASERFLGSSEWRRFAATFAVEGACEGQALQLEPAGDEAAAPYVTGTAWFDDLRVRRVPN